MAIKLPLSVEQFKRLFVNRDDIYSVQQAHGSGYIKTNRPITEQTIKDHMLGKQTIGLYQLKNNTVKWALIDIDINKEVWSQPGFKVEDWQDKIHKQAETIQKILKGRGMTSYRENSGFKGEHVWVFFENPVSSHLVKNVFDGLFKDMKMVDGENMHIEIFPKQSSATDTGPGSLVKAPLGKHQRSGKFSKFIDSVENIELVPTNVIDKAVNGLDNIFDNCGAFRNLRDEGIHSEHLTHEARLAIGYVFANVEGGIDYIEDNLFSKLSDYDPDKTKKALQTLQDKYNPISCAKLQEQGLCSGPCANIGNGKSPVGFFYKQKGFKKEDIKCLNRLDDLVAINNGYYDNKGAVPEKLSNFILNLYEQVHVDDGREQYTTFKGTIINEEGRSYDMEITAEAYSSNEKLTAAIYSALGNSGTYIGDITRIRIASNKFSQKNPITIKKIFGYNDTFSKYYTPSVLITADRVTNNEELRINIEGEGQAEMLDMSLISDKDFEDLKKHIKDDLLTLADFETTHSAFAHTMLAPIAPFVDADDRTKYAFFMRGQSGTGKSFLMTSMQNFYGTFPEDVVTWASTPNAIQRLGYFYKDAFFLVDDFKKANITNYSTMLQILQTYSDNTARSRLKSSGAVAGSWPIKGYIGITGEDTISGEASNIARMITIEYSGKGRDVVKGERVKRVKQLYKAFTPRYIQHILQQDKIEISDTRQKYLREFLKYIDGQPNDVRISRNMAILMTSYDYLAHFLWNKKDAKANIARLKKYLIGLLTDVMGKTVDEKSSTRFWEFLQEFIATDRLQIAPDTNTFTASNKRGAVVGYRTGDKVYLIKNVAYGEVQKLLKQQGEPLKHGMTSIFHDLESEGVIATAKTTSRKYAGENVRVLEVEFDKPDLVDG
ncbi:MAG: hypothetical protein H8D23_19260 [Candidatus Brocadiales bacterium]|nr:hypothetical protein [Candidatus Brocadiales bacterium]